MNLWKRSAILFSLACSMGCAGFKETARDAAAEALREITPMLRETGKEMIDHAGVRLGGIGDKLIDKAKVDIGEAVKAIPGATKDLVAGVSADMVSKRVAVENAAKAAEFDRRVEADGLPAALEWLAGGGGLTIGLYLTRLWWRTRGALKVTAQAVESSPPEVAAVIKQAVASHGGKTFDNEIQAALK